MKKSQQKQIKAWAVFNFVGEDIGDVIFNTKKEAKSYLIEHSYDSNPMVMKKVLQFYKIIPCVISYQLKPLKK